jgi:hypothetical protein
MQRRQRATDVPQILTAYRGDFVCGIVKTSRATLPTSPGFPARSTLSIFMGSTVASGGH